MFRPAATARWRSFAKAVTWRFFGSLDTFLLSFIVVYLVGHQRHPMQAAQFGGILAFGETLTKILLYYCHERVWDKVPFGRADTHAAEPDPVDY